MGTPFPAPLVRGRWEGFWFPLVQPIRVENLWAPFFANVHDARVLELFDERFLAPTQQISRSAKESDIVMGEGGGGIEPH